jgi:DNA anti-recombination protein RmuC
MSENPTSKSIDELLAEADELVQRINAGAFIDLREEHRLQVEKHAQHLKKINAEVRGKIEKKGKSKIDHGAEGMHEAFKEISKAMGELKKFLSGDGTSDVK